MGLYLTLSGVERWHFAKTTSAWSVLEAEYADFSLRTYQGPTYYRKDGGAGNFRWSARGQPSIEFTYGGESHRWAADLAAWGSETGDKVWIAVNPANPLESRFAGSSLNQALLQEWLVGVPLLLLGSWALWPLFKREQKSGSDQPKSADSPSPTAKPSHPAG